MAISQDDRIAFSRKIVAADAEKAALDLAQQEIAKAKETALKLDGANKNLMDSKTVLIDAYQSELSYLDGFVRTNLLESEIQASADRVIGNLFYPNNLSALPPSLGTIWTQTKPYARSLAVGKNNSEVFPSTTTKEADVSAPVDAAITAALAAFVDIERTTGQRCIDGTCSNPLYTDSATCVLNGGVWTPGPTVISSYAAVSTALSDLITKVTALRDFLVLESASIITNDPNGARNAQNVSAKSNLDTVIIPALNTWLGYSSFNTGHGQTTCLGFYSYNTALLGPTKLRATELSALQAAIASRSAFSAIREAQLVVNLGTLTQNLSNGSVSGAGLYYDRYLIIQLRIGLLGGSLIVAESFDKAEQAQIELKQSIDDAKTAYLAVIFCSALSAPANGTKYVSVKDASGFVAGDTVYIITDTQAELRRNVEAVAGNRLLLGEAVPSKYRESDLGRVYKDI